MDVKGVFDEALFNVDLLFSSLRNSSQSGNN